MSYIERLIQKFSPEKAFKREQYRLALARSYEAAQRSRRTKNWYASSASASTENSNQIEILRNRSRDLIRNDSYAARAASVVPSAVVGAGISCNVMQNDVAGDNALQRQWDDWANSTSCDFEGRSNFAGIQYLIMRSVFESGEAIVRIRRQSDSEIPLSLQVLESDHLANYAEFLTTKNNNRVVNGVEIDKSGRVVAYHLYDDHPGSYGEINVSLRDNLIPKRVPASEVLHVFRRDRPGQLRGVCWLHPVMLKLRELAEFEDAYLVRAKISACFSAFIYDSESPDPLAVDKDSGFELEKLAPGIIEHLPPGKDIKFGDPKGEGGEQYRYFVSTHLKAIASGIGVSYEVLSSDYSEVNFSSARMAEIQFRRNIESWQNNLITAQLNRPVFSLFKSSLALAKGINVNDVKDSWIPPKRDVIDPTKEIPAKIKEIRSGMLTFSDAIRQSGKDPKRHFEELASDKQELERLGLVLDSDASKTTLAGQAQIEFSGDEEGESDENS